VATIDAAGTRNVPKFTACAAFAAVMAMSVTGCSTGGDFLPGFSQPQSGISEVRQKRSVATKSMSSIAVAPLIGPPDNVSKQFMSQLGSELSNKSVRVIQPGSQNSSSPQSKYNTLRGYVVAATESAGTKVSYIWDITGSSGNRLQRITGEEVVQTVSANNPWSSVDPSIMAKIAKRTADEVASWMSKNSSPSATAKSFPSRAPASVAGARNSGNTTALSAAARSSQTGSIKTSAQSKLAVYVPRVSGAPGDGSTSLSLALQKELRKNGLTLTNKAANAAHVVEGLVVVGAPNSGKQPIKIDWVVKSPSGTKLGTVSQKNQIPAGSLDGKWGTTAGAAASAAAQGIIRLLPSNSSLRS